jgi:hypothetical protein
VAVATLRRETDKVVRLADVDLNHLWQLVAAGAAADQALFDLLPAIVTQYGTVGAALAAEWYDEQRAKVEARGAFAAIPLDAGDRGAHALVGWALATATDDTSLKTLIAGGVQRRIVDHARLTVMSSSTSDPAARGWRRVGDGHTCEFCSMLLGRGAVYSEATADFPAHDHCGCSAEPDWL